jgi:hypothetical protein
MTTVYVPADGTENEVVVTEFQGRFVLGHAALCRVVLGFEI